MMRLVKTLLRYLLLVLFGATCWYLLSESLDMPTQELLPNMLSTLHATAAMLLLAAASWLLHRPRLRLTLTDLFAAALFAGVTVSRLLMPGLASAAKYDELLQAAMLYTALRILYTADRRNLTVLLMLLCWFGMREAWTGIRQIYGFAYSNHGLFKITGSFFNPGPYAGFIAVTGVCGVAAVVRWQKLTSRAFGSWTALRRQRPGVLLWGVAACLLGWGAAILCAVVLPSTMSRAGLIAVAAGCAVLVIRELDFVGRIRRVWRLRPLRTGLYAVLACLLFGGAAAGAYWIKRPSADGRLLMWKIDTRMMLRNPLCGVGLGNFAGAFGAEQAAYFAEEERPQAETQVAGCPEAGFNEYLQFGAETGVGGFVVLLLMTGTALVSLLRRGSPFGYGLLVAAIFACFSYPWSVLPLRLVFVVLLAAAHPKVSPRPAKRSTYALFALALAGCMACWPGLYGRYKARVDARLMWSDVRMWVSTGRYDYAVEDGARFLDILQYDYRFLYDYGYALHKTCDYRHSNRILALGMQLSSDPMFWNIAGKNHEALGDYVAAEAAYRRSHLTIPDRVYPLYLLAGLYFKTGQTAKAAATARRVVRHRPKVESVQTRNMQEELRGRLDSLLKIEIPER